ncbi:c-type cytochrome [Cyclobacterium sp. 1_MG-2023]|uniref:PVC-type heme-binding CxxCH protein n=1 Tax=Cyclobacterium sp. 1_MG-2023 TaxID=3062681 RepID=UPI0026E2DC26|nr:PVC-type heme-binding CxxCH protein [Cyclobacterium sp. 1_MG-2023]MDO6438917.1 c-type cytochrome [Cyclobacterium sp. 1_MG-2023]
MKSAFYLFFILTIFIGLGCKEKAPNSPTDAAGNEYIDYNHKTQSARTKLFSPEEELAGFEVPEGFVVELVASERDGVVNPIHIAFDDAGKLWTQTAEMYPMDPVSDIAWHELLNLMDNPEAQEEDPNFRRIFDLYRGKTKGKDKILVLSDLYGKNKVKSTIWADGLAIPQSVLPYKNGSFVAQGSELFFLEDTDEDGKADKRTPLFTGFGITDTHTMAHALVRAPGDWIHFSHGALNKGKVSSLISDVEVRIDYSKIVRFSLDASKMELVNSGLQNIWGYKLRGNGQWYGIEANDLGYSIVPMEKGTGFPGIGNDRIRPYQPWMPELHEFRVGGTGISGVAFADDLDGSFPKEWKDVAFIANPITSSINAVRILRKSDGSVTAEHLPDFLTSQDDWFRPVNMEFGPDGSLYIVDWYNKIVSHNEVGTSHPDRDKSHGRIWRVRHKSQPSREIPNFYEVKTSELVAYLKSPSIWAKRAAWHQISDRPIEETRGLAKELIELASDSAQDEITRIMALWSLEGIKHYDQNLMKTLLSSRFDNLRREAIRALQSFPLNAAVLAALLRKPSSDSNPMVRSQVLRTLETVNTANEATIGLLVEACKEPLEGNAMGGAYERNFERFLARKALENYPTELLDFFRSPVVEQYETSNLIWASQALPQAEKEQVFIELWKKNNKKDLDEVTFVLVAEMLGNRKVLNLILPILENRDMAVKHVSLTLMNQARVQSEELTKALIEPISHLLKSSDVSDQMLGLEAIGKLKIQGLRSEVLSLVDDNSSTEMVRLYMSALINQPKENQKTFMKLSKMETLEVEVRASAIQTVAITDVHAANQILVNWLPNLDSEQKKKVINILANAKEGIKLLKLLLEQGHVYANEFDLSSAEKIFHSDKSDEQGKRLYEEVKNRVKEEKNELELKLQTYMAIAEKGDGNPKKGKTLFQTCLMCHSVGDQGFDFAPALDGSSLRENEALLTAILEPDAAVESNYLVYRVTKNDGSNIEGYLVKKDERGTTLGFMGGSKQFIQASEIRFEGHLGGRSFMPKGLIDNFSEEQVADLLAYIKTLK